MPNFGFRTFHKVLETELHQALHHSVEFEDPNMAEMPGFQNCWNAGFLMGMHFAMQYPRIVLAVDKHLFDNPESTAPTLVADMLAEAVTDKLLAPEEVKRKPKATEEDLIQRLVALRLVDEGKPIIDGDYWPFPPKPVDFHDQYSKGAGW
jgi:hypothetical protein